MLKSVIDFLLLLFAMVALVAAFSKKKYLFVAISLIVALVMLLYIFVDAPHR